MSQQKESNIEYQGVNSSGNKYTVYKDGKYRYVNMDFEGKVRSEYFDAGKGHSFYRQKGSNGSEGYTWHENANKGYRDYKFKVPSADGSKSSKETKTVHIQW